MREGAIVKDTVLLEEMSWPEVGAALAAGKRTVVIMTASIEQHGPHLPLLTDTGIGQAVGERVARGLGSALLAPVIRPGCSDHHLAFPGSLSIPESVFIDTVVAYARSLAPHGFDTFVLLSSHGGNFGALEKAAARLRAELGQTGVRIIDLAGRQALLDTMRVMVDTAAALGAPQDVDAIHAEVTETSIMLRRYPSLVDATRLEQGRMGRIDNDALFRDGLRAITSNGILGDARGATAEIGDAVLGRLSDHIVAEVRRQLALR
jgi:creatinine amidohydrolase